MHETPPRLLVTVAGLTPGAPLDAAVVLADALDARRVPLTLLVGPRPHPEVAAWATSRRRTGDLALLHGTRPDAMVGRPYRRLPAHEAGLRLAAALRTREVLGPAVDGFAAPGWSISPGTRRALVAGGLELCVDDTGVHRLGPDGATVRSWPGPVLTAVPRRARPSRRPAPDLVHLALDATTPLARAGALVDEALATGTTPLTTAEVAPPRAPRRTGAAGDPEHWSLTS